VQTVIRRGEKGEEEEEVGREEEGGEEYEG